MRKIPTCHHEDAIIHRVEHGHFGIECVAQSAQNTCERLQKNLIVAFHPFIEKSGVNSNENWLIENVTSDNVGRLFGNLSDGDIRLIKTVHLKNVKATNLLSGGIQIYGDARRQSRLILTNVEMSLQPGNQDRSLIDVKDFGYLESHNVTLHNSGKHPVLRAESGDTVWLDGVNYIPASNSTPYSFTSIDNIICNAGGKRSTGSSKR